MQIVTQLVTIVNEFVKNCNYLVKYCYFIPEIRSELLYFTSHRI